MIRTIYWNRLAGRKGPYHIAVKRLADGPGSSEHGQDFFEFFLVHEGRGRHFLNGRNLPLKPGSAAIVTRNDRHRYATDPGKPLVFTNLAVSAKWWKAFQETCGPARDWEKQAGREGHFQLPEPVCRKLESCFAALMAARPVPPWQLAETWLLILRSFAELSKPGRRANLPPWLKKLKQDLSDPDLMAEPYSFWLKRSGRSAEHLARACRAHFGAPLTELINQERIERAKFLLRAGDPKVTTIAYAVGYNNLAHFYRVFQRLVGKSPHRWRLDSAQSTVPL